MCSTSIRVSVTYEHMHACRRLCTWGAGRFGQLGNKARHDTAQLQDITESIPQESGRVVQVSAGCGHSGVVTECGHAYTFGDNRYNQLGKTMLSCLSHA